MAAGIFQGRFNITAIQTLDALTGGAQTYSYLNVRGISGSVYMGNSAVTSVNGFQLSYDPPHRINVSVAGSALNFVGNGVLEFFGIATA